MSKNGGAKPKKKTEHTLAQNLVQNLFKIFAIIAAAGFICTMFTIVQAVIDNMYNNPVNAVIYNLRQSTDMTAAAVAAITETASNAVSSTTLIVTVAGVFMTVVSIFAAMLVYIANAKLDDINKKIAEFDTRIDVETYMRHLSSGIRYWDKGLYNYALKEFEPGLTSKDESCRLSANYYMGLLHIDRFMVNSNTIDFEKAEKHLSIAKNFSPEIDPIIHNDSCASLGCLYGVWVEKNFDSAFYGEYLNKSERLLKKAINNTFELAVHYKNLAITYALKKDVEKAKQYIEKGIQKDTNEKGLIDETTRKKNAKDFFEKLFNEEEKDLMQEINIYEEIKDFVTKKYNFDIEAS